MNTTQKANLYLIIGFFILFISGCNQRNPSSQEKHSYNYNSDTIKIPINEDYIQSYTSVQNQTVKEKLYGYNVKLNAFDVFDLKEKKVLSKIALEKEGPNGISTINAFNVGADFIVLDDQHHYIIINFDGKVIRRISKESISSSEMCKDYLLTSNICISNFTTQCFDNERNELVIPIFPRIADQYENKNCLATFNINTEEFKILPTPYPDIFTKHSFGLLSKPYILCKGDSIIYNFPMSSSIYIYDRNTQETIEKKVDSSFTSNTSEKFDDKKWHLVDHYFRSTFFYNVKYDPYRNLYYRLHVKNIHLNDDMRSKEGYITIIDADFQKLDEYRLKENIFYVYNITPDGLLFEFMKAPFEDDYAALLITSSIINPLKWPEFEETSVIDDIIIKNKNIEKEKSDKKEEDFFDIDRLRYMSDIKGFVYENLIYPAEEYEKGIEGNVFVVMKRDEKGYIIDYSIPDLEKDNKITQNMKEEALRIAKLIKRIDPHKGGEIVGFHVPFIIQTYNKRHNL